MSESTEASFLKPRLAEIQRASLDRAPGALHEMVAVRFLRGVADPANHVETEPMAFDADWTFTLYKDPDEVMGDRFTDVTEEPICLMFSPSETNPLLAGDNHTNDQHRLELKVCPGGVYDETDGRWLDTPEIEALHKELEPIFYPDQNQG